MPHLFRLPPTRLLMANAREPGHKLDAFGRFAIALMLLTAVMLVLLGVFLVVALVVDALA